MSYLVRYASYKPPGFGYANANKRRLPNVMQLHLHSVTSIIYYAVRL